MTSFVPKNIPNIGDNVTQTLREYVAQVQHKRGGQCVEKCKARDRISQAAMVALGATAFAATTYYLWNQQPSVQTPTLPEESWHVDNSDQCVIQDSWDNYMSWIFKNPSSGSFRDHTEECAGSPSCKIVYPLGTEPQDNDDWDFPDSKRSSSQESNSLYDVVETVATYVGGFFLIVYGLLSTNE